MNDALHHAVVIPGGAEEPHRIVGWDTDGELPGVLRANLHTAQVACLHHGLTLGPGRIRLYVAQNMFADRPVIWNDRALALLHHLGHRHIIALAGPVLVTGDATPDGDVNGLLSSQLEWLDLGMREVTTAVIRARTAHMN